MESIEWHEERLINMKVYLKRKSADLDLLQMQVNRQQKRIDFLDYQIEEAKKIGKVKFDQDKFRVKKKDK